MANKTDSNTRTREEINRKSGSDKVAFCNKLSTRVTYLIIAMVLIPMSILTFVSLNQTTEAMETTYKTYAMNLAQEAAVGIDFATSSSEGTYGNYALNLA